MFIVKNKLNRLLVVSKPQIRLFAKSKAIHYPMGSKELALDKYLVAKYNLDLKHCCLLLITKCSIIKNADEDWYISFPNKELDAMANLITYGNGALIGSSILRDIFK